MIKQLRDHILFKIGIKMVFINIIFIIIALINSIRKEVLFLESLSNVYLSFFTTTNETISIPTIIAITGGILTLVGLVSIFISIDSQHSVQKAKELYWEIIGLKAKHQLGNIKSISQEFKEKFYKYHEIVNKSNSNDFTNRVINLALSSIEWVIIIWSAVIFAVMTIYHPFDLLFIVSTVIGIILLLRFHIFLKELLDIKKVGKLEKPEFFLTESDQDIEKYVESKGWLLFSQFKRRENTGNKVVNEQVLSKDEHSIFWFAISLILRIKKPYRKNKIKIELGTFFPFKDFTIRIIMRGSANLSEKSYGIIYNEERNINFTQDVDSGEIKWIEVANAEIETSNENDFINPYEVVAGIVIMSKRNPRKNVFVQYHGTSPLESKVEHNDLLLHGWVLYPERISRDVEIQSLEKMYKELLDLKPKIPDVNDKLNTIIKLLKVEEDNNEATDMDRIEKNTRKIREAEKQKLLNESKLYRSLEKNIFEACLVALSTKGRSGIPEDIFEAYQEELIQIEELISRGKLQELIQILDLDGKTINEVIYTYKNI